MLAPLLNPWSAVPWYGWVSIHLRWAPDSAHSSSLQSDPVASHRGVKIGKKGGGGNPKQFDPVASTRGDGFRRMGVFLCVLILSQGPQKKAMRGNPKDPVVSNRGDEFRRRGSFYALCSDLVASHRCDKIKGEGKYQRYNPDASHWGAEIRRRGSS